MPDAPAAREVDFFLDVVSPYTWLALVAAEEFAAAHGVSWRLHPIVYAAVLEARGLIGPVETPDKRRYTFADIARCAAIAGVRFTGPPAHPFRSVEALRVLALFRDDARALPLARDLANAAWAEGRDLTEVRVLTEVVAAAGLDASDLPSRLAAPETKAALRESTDRALTAGVFGVPTFGWNGELFWGHDRLPHLAARLDGRLPDTSPAVSRALARPMGVERKK